MIDQPLELYGTRRSHFTRKVRLLMDHLGLSYDFKHVGDVSSNDLKTFLGNPAMVVPVLKMGSKVLYDSDNIAEFIARHCDPENVFKVRIYETDELNGRAIMNSAMLSSAKLVLAARSDIAIEGVSFLEKSTRVIKSCLTWLDVNLKIETRSPVSYREFHFISMWDHLVLYEFIDPVQYDSLARYAANIRASEIVLRSAPY